MINYEPGSIVTIFPSIEIEHKRNAWKPLKIVRVTKAGLYLLENEKTGEQLSIAKHSLKGEEYIRNNMTIQTARYPLGSAVETSQGLLIIRRPDKPPEVFREACVEQTFSDGVDFVVKYTEDDDTELTQKLIVEYKPDDQD